MGHEKWFPVYKKIQAAGKNIVTTVTPSRLSVMYRKFDAKGLYIRTIFIDKHLSEYYLPDFMGGDGGEIIAKGIKWVESEGENRMNREEFNHFLEENDIILGERNPAKLRKEINRKLK